MNKKVIAILVLTVVGLILLTMISFGPLGNLRERTRINSSSYRPSPQQMSGMTLGSKDSASSAQPPVLDIYRNIDVRENYYEISVPHEWQISAGDAPGGYKIRFSGGNGSVELTDVPDNTTLELYVLSQEEPRLKKEVKGYHRVDYQKTDINGSLTYQLTYGSEMDQIEVKTVSTYITGMDRAGVITFRVVSADFANVQPIADKVIKSFAWRNK